MSKITEEARQLFRQSLSDVTPLRQTARVTKPTTDKSLKKRLHARRQGLPDRWFDTSDTPEHIPFMAQAESTLIFQRMPLPANQINRLRRGNFSTRCLIDLHGLTEAQAELRMQDWLHHCHYRTDRYGLIVHGKGLSSTHEHPILKNWLNWWLRNQARVLAFHTAQTNDGGAGALYVLLAPPTSHLSHPHRDQ